MSPFSSTLSGRLPRVIISKLDSGSSSIDKGVSAIVPTFRTPHTTKEGISNSSIPLLTEKGSSIGFGDSIVIHESLTEELLKPEGILTEVTASLVTFID